MLKKVQVIILPAKEETQSYITLLHGKLYLNDKLHGYDTIQKTQHLYFLLDEEIKEGDWYLELILDKIYRASKNLGKLQTCRNIIATTDSSLKIDTMFQCLPKPSQLFLEAFVKEYNKGNVIKEVMVEYEDKGWEDWMGDNENGEPIWIKDFKLKVNSKDNTITIKRVKDSWNREEVISLFHKYALEGDIGIDDINKWIEQNL